MTRHNHTKHKTLEKKGVRVAECICGARKLLIDGVKTNWIEGSYKIMEIESVEDR